jgi:hypothetical protein
MHILAVEFQEAFYQYLKLTEALKSIFNVDESQGPQALVRSILENQDCLMQIRKMDARVLELSNILQQCREELDPEDREKINSLSNALNTQSLHVRELCRQQEQRVQSRRDHLAKELMGIGNGVRYLKELSPNKTNFPKFIDSTC